VISQRNSFTEDSLADQWAQGTVNDHLHRPSQQLLQIGDKTAREPRRRLVSHVDEEIYITLGRFLTARNGAEQTHVSCPVARRHAKDFFAPLLNLFADGHVVYFIANGSTAVQRLKGVNSSRSRQIEVGSVIRTSSNNCYY
jgi:hypothetical protein